MIAKAVLWFALLSCGVIGGLYFAFSAFIMTSLSRLDPGAGMAAMNAINVDIQRSLFMPLFLGSTLAAGALAVIGVLRWGEAGAAAMLAGGVLYVVGMFVVTMVFNVPLNNQIAAAAASAEAPQVWARYLRDWTPWNHVRTLASVGATALFVAALAGR